MHLPTPARVHEFADTYENIVFRFDGRVVSNIFHRRRSSNSLSLSLELFRASFHAIWKKNKKNKINTEIKFLTHGVSSSINYFRLRRNESFVIRIF